MSSRSLFPPPPTRDRSTQNIPSFPARGNVHKCSDFLQWLPQILTDETAPDSENGLHPQFQTADPPALHILPEIQAAWLPPLPVSVFPHPYGQTHTNRLPSYHSRWATPGLCSALMQVHWREDNRLRSLFPPCWSDCHKSARAVMWSLLSYFRSRRCRWYLPLTDSNPPLTAAKNRRTECPPSPRQWSVLSFGYLLSMYETPAVLPSFSRLIPWFLLTFLVSMRHNIKFYSGRMDWSCVLRSSHSS